MKVFRGRLKVEDTLPVRYEPSDRPDAVVTNKVSDRMRRAADEAAVEQARRRLER